MWKKAIAKRLYAAVFAAAGVLGTVATAEAAVFGLSFDPSFGGSFNDLGFRGDAQLFVPDACLDGFYHFNGDPCSLGNTMALQSAHVELYRFGGVNPPTLADAIFTAAQLAGQVTGVMTDLDTGVIGLDTGLIGEQIVHVADGPGGVNVIYDGPIWLYFVSTFMPVLELALNAADPAFIVLGTCDGPCFPDLQNPSNPATVTFTRIAQVPEPGTLALLLGACGAGWLARRRAKAAA